MDGNRTEVETLDEAQEQYSSFQLRELGELQLAFVGGGMGETTL